jgi:hypothetical protein
MSLYFFAGDRAGECKPSGESVESVFGANDAAAAIYLADLYCEPGIQTCVVRDSDHDPEAGIDIDEDALTAADARRLEALRSIVWTERLFGLSAELGGVRMDVSFHEDNPHGRWYARTNTGSLWSMDLRQAQARIAVAALAEHDAALALEMAS